MCRIIGLSRRDLSEQARAIGCEYVRSAELLMDEEPEVVIFSTSIMSLDSVLAKFPTSRLSDCLVVDVLSVKMYPQELLLRHLPSNADILCTHPMFGPESGKDTWYNLPFVYDRVRINPLRMNVCDQFLQIWNTEGCKMVPMSCSQHDSYAASTQFITHTTGRLNSHLSEASPHHVTGHGGFFCVCPTFHAQITDMRVLHIFVLRARCLVTLPRGPGCDYGGDVGLLMCGFV